MLTQVAVDELRSRSMEQRDRDNLDEGEIIYRELDAWLARDELEVQSQTRNNTGLHLFDKATFWLEKMKGRLAPSSWAHRFLQVKYLTRRMFKETNNPVFFDDVKHAIHEVVGLRQFTDDERIVYMVDRTSLAER